MFQDRSLSTGAGPGRFEVCLASSGETIICGALETRFGEARGVEISSRDRAASPGSKKSITAP